MHAAIHRPIASVGLALGLVCAPALAGEASIEIDWDTFAYETIDVGFGAPALVWTSQSGDAYAYASGYAPDWVLSYPPTVGRSDWSTEIQVAAQIPPASANAMANAALLRVQAQAQTSLGNPPVSVNYGLAGANNYGYFTLSGAGGVFFQVDYSVSLQGQAGDYFDYGLAVGSMVLYLSGAGDGLSGGGQNASSVQLASYTEGTQSGHTGRLVAGLFSSAAESSGFLTVNATAQAQAPAVPIPELQTAWLLLAGLAAMGWIARRRLAR